MKRILEHTEPRDVLYFFEDLTRIPRESGKEEKVAAYLQSFAQERGLECMVDEARNVIIKKPASPGREDHPPVILQAHSDMVCEKNQGTVHDFDKDPIRFEIDGDKIIAKETTLGADDGIGVAMALAMLADPEAKHPPLEAVFTTDEECGFGGVNALSVEALSARRMINLDADDEGILVVGCAGGPLAIVRLPIQREAAAADWKPFRLHLTGLLGGHSGEDIHRGRGNAMQMLSRVLSALDRESAYAIADIWGGLQNNAIPREAAAEILVPPQQLDAVQRIVQQYQTIFAAEFRLTDPGITLSLEPGAPAEQVLTRDAARRVVQFLYLSETGILRMDPKFTDCVESSVCMSVLRLYEDYAEVQTLTRSSVASMYTETCHKVAALASCLGGTVEFSENYPEWTPAVSSPLQDLFIQVYEEMFGKTPKMIILHAGLECGVLSQKIGPDLDAIACGSDLRNLHSPGEYVTISSLQKFWKYFKETMSRL